MRRWMTIPGGNKFDDLNSFRQNSWGFLKIVLKGEEKIVRTLKNENNFVRLLKSLREICAYKYFYRPKVPPP